MSAKLCKLNYGALHSSLVTFAAPYWPPIQSSSFIWRFAHWQMWRIDVNCVCVCVDSRGDWQWFQYRQCFIRLDGSVNVWRAIPEQTRVKSAIDHVRRTDVSIYVSLSVWASGYAMEQWINEITLDKCQLDRKHVNKYLSCHHIESSQPSSKQTVLQETWTFVRETM